MKILQGSKKKGIVVTVIMAASVTAMAGAVIGWWALFLFAAAMAVLWLFLNDFDEATRLGTEHAQGA
jgi:hypothetical protein